MLRPTTWLLLVFASTSSLLMGLSVPLIRGRVRPNGLYGIRTPRTLGDESAWYPANAYGGRLLFRAGLVGLCSSAAFFLVPRLRSDLVAYSAACGAVIVGGLAIAVIRTFRRIRQL